MRDEDLSSLLLCKSLLVTSESRGVMKTYIVVSVSGRKVEMLDIIFVWSSTSGSFCLQFARHPSVDDEVVGVLEV